MPCTPDRHICDPCDLKPPRPRSHTGIRLKITIPSGQSILEADSDWLHMNAIMNGALHMPDTMAELMTDQAPEYDWVEVWRLIGGPIQIWIQPAMLSDPADASDQDPDPADASDWDQDPDPADASDWEPAEGYCQCSCSSCSGCIGD